MHTSSEALAARRARAAASWKGNEAVVVIGAGGAIPIPGGADQTFPFRVHPDYRWLTDRATPGGVLAFDPSDGAWTEFLPAVTEAERIWEGRVDSPSPDARPISELANWLASRASRTIASLGVPPDGVLADPGASARLSQQLLHARRPKDSDELSRVRRAADATARAFARAREVTRPGTTERAIQIELEAEAFRAGADRMAYGTIVGSGPNSAVLHFEPSQRTVGEDEFVLIDAGAEVMGYCADVTRTLAASGRFTPERQAIYDLVLHAQQRALARCRPGVEWREVHRTTARDLAEGLVSLGFLRGSADGLLESEAIALFFPHGVGHMVGLGVRDAGGRLPDAPPASDQGCCGVRLRVDLPLERGYLMTIEPGLYIVPALLNDTVRRAKFSSHVDWNRVDDALAKGLGGVRIEDNVLVTDAGPEVLTTAIPK